MENMAESTHRFEHSENLFVNPDGSPIVFFMRPCAERQSLKPLIVHGGGQVTAKFVKHCYKLAEKGSVVSKEGYISTWFIEECVKQNKLLDTADFSVKAGSTVRNDPPQKEEMSDSDSVDLFADDGSLAPASYIKDQMARDLKGRQKYTPEDDIAIIMHIAEKGLGHRTSGKALWKKMELLQVTKHTAESMSSRYRRNIVPNLNRYKDDVDPQLLRELSNSRSPRKKHEEFTYDALFKANTDKFMQKQKDQKCISNTENKRSGGESSHGNDVPKPNGNAGTSEWLKKTSPIKTQSRKVPLDIQVIRTQKNKVTAETSQQDDNETFTPDSFIDKHDGIAIAVNDPSKKNKEQTEIGSETSKRKNCDDKMSKDTGSKRSKIIELDDGRLTASQGSGDEEDFESYVQKSWKTYDRDFVQSHKNGNSSVNNAANIDDAMEIFAKGHEACSSKGESKQGEDSDSNMSVDSVDDQLLHRIKAGKSTRHLEQERTTKASDTKSSETTVNGAKSTNTEAPANSRQTASVSCQDDAIDECGAVCKQLADKYGLPVSYVNDLMYWNSGYVQRTINYIEFKRFSMDPPPWNEEDDSAFRTEYKRLCAKYGEKDVKDRARFLNGL